MRCAKTVRHFLAPLPSPARRFSPLTPRYRCPHLTRQAHGARGRVCEPEVRLGGVDRSERGLREEAQRDLDLAVAASNTGPLVVWRSTAPPTAPQSSSHKDDGVVGISDGVEVVDDVRRRGGELRVPRPNNPAAALLPAVAADGMARDEGERVMIVEAARVRAEPEWLDEPRVARRCWPPGVRWLRLPARGFLRGGVVAPVAAGGGKP